MNTQSQKFFPEDLIAEVLSVLPVKSILRFRCVSNSWNTLISDATFVKLHLNRSKSRNPLFTLITIHTTTIPGKSPYGSDDEGDWDCSVDDEWDGNYSVDDEGDRDCSVVPYPIDRLIENSSFNLDVDPYYYLNDHEYSHVAGSCNGLICVAYFHSHLDFDPYYCEYHEYSLFLWNPATRTKSPKFGYFRDFGYPTSEPFASHNKFNFKFGYDNSTDTYKVVGSCYNYHQQTSNVKILSVGDNVWRDIQSFPVIPLHLNYHGNHDHEGVYLSGTLNWLAIHNDFQYHFRDIKNIKVEQFVIVSLDLGTETYNQYLLPRGFDAVPPAEPTIGVLGDCLCFSYSYKETDFIIWQMKKFGIEESWTQFLKISYHSLQLDYDFSSDDNLKYHLKFIPLLLSKDGDTLVLKSSQDREAILYNWRYNRIERPRFTVNGAITNDRTTADILWYLAKGYVESLVSIC